MLSHSALEKGIDIGLVPNIKDLLPLNGINKRNMKWENPEHLEAVQHLVKELATRGIVGLRPTRARMINLGIFLIIKPNGKFRFILNGRPLSPQHDSVLVVGGIQIYNIIYIYIRCWKKRI